MTLFSNNSKKILALIWKKKKLLINSNNLGKLFLKCQDFESWASFVTTRFFWYFTLVADVHKLDLSKSIYFKMILVLSYLYEIIFLLNKLLSIFLDTFTKYLFFNFYFLNFILVLNFT